MSRNDPDGLNIHQESMRLQQTDQHGPSSRYQKATWLAEQLRWRLPSARSVGAVLVSLIKNPLKELLSQMTDAAADDVRGS